MQKEKLFDCCGAYHVYGFPNDPTSLIHIHAWKNKSIKEGCYVNAGWLLEQFSSGKHGEFIPIPDKVGMFIYNPAPGLMTAVLSEEQIDDWEDLLIELGWTLACDNACNSNSYNRLFFWIKVERNVDEKRPRPYTPAKGRTKAKPAEAFPLMMGG